MSIGREIEDIARDLIKHQHDHPPVRDLNREVQRKLTFSDRVADDFARLVGSWMFVLAQVAIMVVWVGLNALNLIRPWDRYPFLFLNVILSLEAAIWVSVLLMALNRFADRDRARVLRPELHEPRRADPRRDRLVIALPRRERARASPARFQPRVALERSLDALPRPPAGPCVSHVASAPPHNRPPLPPPRAPPPPDRPSPAPPARRWRWRA